MAILSRICNKDKINGISDLMNESNSKTITDTISNNSKDMFHSCFSSPGCESNLSFVQEFLVEDRHDSPSLT